MRSAGKHWQFASMHMADALVGIISTWNAFARLRVQNVRSVASGFTSEPGFQVSLTMLPRGFLMFRHAAKMR